MREEKREGWSPVLDIFVNFVSIFNKFLILLISAFLL